jgi:transposase
MLTDAQWAMLEPLLEICRPTGKTAPQDLRRTLSAILWRHQNGAKWRSVPAELGALVTGGPDLHSLVTPGRVGAPPLNWLRRRELQLGMTFLDGTSIRAHQKAAGARRKGHSS